MGYNKRSRIHTAAQYGTNNNLITHIERPTFRASFSDSGVHLLDEALTINGTTVYPTFRYEGKDRSGASWAPAAGASAPTLAQVDSGDFTEYGTPFLDDTKAIGGDGTVSFSSAWSTTPFSSGIDFAVEGIIKMNGSTGGNVMGCRTNGGGGWNFYIHADGTLRFHAYNGASLPTLTSLPVTQNAWNYFFLTLDRDEASSYGCRFWCHAGETGDNFSALSGSNLSGAGVSIADLYNGTSAAATTPVAYFAAYALGTGAMPGGATNQTLTAAVAQERFYRLTGIYPEVANGTALPVDARTGRSSSAYLEKIENGAIKYYLVGDNWLRVCQREDDNGEVVTGYLAEPEATNQLNYSSDLTQAGTWVTTNCSVVVSATEIAPDGSAAEAIIPDATNGEHKITFTYSGSTSAKKTAISLYCKIGGTNAIRMKLISDNGNYALVGLYANGTKFRVGAYGIQGEFIENIGNGWYRIGIGFQQTFGTADMVIEIGSHSNFAGDGSTEEWYVWAPQVEWNESYTSTSYIPTTTTAATRSADALEYKGDDGNLGGVGSEKQGTIKCDVLCPDIGTPSGNPRLFSINDGGSYDEKIYAYSAARTFFGTSTDGGGSGAANLPAAMNVYDGEKHSLKFVWKEGQYVAQYLDGTEMGDRDTTDIVVPDDLDRIGTGVSNGGTGAQPNGLISNLKIYKKVVE